jgi:hypothetical protein
MHSLFTLLRAMDKLTLTTFAGFEEGVAAEPPSRGHITWKTTTGLLKKTAFGDFQVQGSVSQKMLSLHAKSPTMLPGTVRRLFDAEEWQLHTFPDKMATADEATLAGIREKLGLGSGVSLVTGIGMTRPQRQFVVEELDAMVVADSRPGPHRFTNRDGVLQDPGAMWRGWMEKVQQELFSGGEGDEAQKRLDEC